MAAVLTGLEKVAVLLKSLPAPVVAKLMSHLDTRRAAMLNAELARIGTLPDWQQKLSGVLDEAIAALVNTSPVAVHSAGLTATLAAGKPGASVSSSASSSFDIRVGDGAGSAAPLPPPKPPIPWPPANMDPLQAVPLIPPQLLAAALESESAATISALLDCLTLEVAGQIYKRLSPVKRKEVSGRFTRQSALGEELIKRIAQAVIKKCETLRDAAVPTTSETSARDNRIASLLRGLERTDRQEALTALEESDPETTARVKAMLYQFEDILRMENTSVQKMLSEVDMKSLALALRGADEDIEAKILANLSKRAQESLKEEISLTGTVPQAKIKAARQTLEEAMQRLDQRGELMMVDG